jgi:hypothetical protein
MQTLSLLPSQIKNRVGLQQQSPYPAETYGYPPSSASGYDAPSLTSPPAYDSTAFSQSPPLQPQAQIAPYANPAFAAPLVVAATPVSIFSKPMTWVLSGLTAIGLGGLVYFNLDWIKDKLGIGGDAGKKERAKAQYETLKTKFTNAETPEAKKEIVTEMLSVLERNDAALLKDLPKNGLNAYATELRTLKDEGKTFAQTALTKASKALGKSSGGEEPKEALKTGAKEAGKLLKNSGALDTFIRVGAIAATIPLWWSVALTSGLAGWLSSLGIGTAIASLGSGIAANASGAGASIAVAAATPLAKTVGTAAVASYATAAAVNPEAVKTPVRGLVYLVTAPFKAMGSGIKKLRP